MSYIADKNIEMPYIIAVDFDGTLVEDKFPEIGEIKRETWDAVRLAKDSGFKLILWTSRDGEQLKEAVAFCADKGLHFDAINENIDEVKILYNNDTRKVFANEYWDDRAVKCYCMK